MPITAIPLNSSGCEMIYSISSSDMPNWLPLVRRSMTCAFFSTNPASCAPSDIHSSITSDISVACLMLSQVSMPAPYETARSISHFSFITPEYMMLSGFTPSAIHISSSPGLHTSTWSKPSGSL